MIYIKKIVSFYFLIVIPFVLFTSDNVPKRNHIYDNLDELSIYDKILDTTDDVEDYLYNKYGFYGDFSCYEVTGYAPLSTQNVSQTSRKNYYNNLENLRFDINNDGIINDFDNLGDSGGICQPTAVSMAIRYMTYRNDFSYSPSLSNDSLDINNVFYEVVENYIDVGWEGNGASRPMCANALNHLFLTNNSSYTATYYSSNIYSLIVSAYNNHIPIIGHISDNTSGHAVTIAGYLTMHVSYVDDTVPWEEDELIHYSFNEYFAIINTGWVETPPYWELYPITFPMWLYDYNYSYINIEDLDGVTYIC